MIHSAAVAARPGRSPFAGAPSSPVTATASVSKGGGYIVPLRPSGSSAWLWQQPVRLREVELSGHVLEEAVRVLVVAGPFDLGHAQRDGRIEAREHRLYLKRQKALLAALVLQREEAGDGGDVEAAELVQDRA